LGEHIPGIYPSKPIDIRRAIVQKTLMSVSSNNSAHWPLIGASVVALLLLAVAFTGWLHFGSSILLDYAAAGLSWCF